jgi:hypothetical protein
MASRDREPFEYFCGTEKSDGIFNRPPPQAGGEILDGMKPFPGSTAGFRFATGLFHFRSASNHSIIAG